MDHHSVAYVGFDTSKTKHAVASRRAAERGRWVASPKSRPRRRPLSSFCISCW